MLSKPCAIIVLGIHLRHPEWIGIGVRKYFTECYLCVLPRCASMPFHCIP